MRIVLAMTSRARNFLVIRTILVINLIVSGVVRDKVTPPDKLLQIFFHDNKFFRNNLAKISVKKSVFSQFCTKFFKFKIIMIVRTGQQ